MAPRIIVCIAIVFLFSLSYTTPPLSAEEFRVMQTFGTLDDESCVEEQPDIIINLPKYDIDKEKATKIAEAVIKREMENGQGEEPHDVFFKLVSIENKNGIWYLAYKWEYTSFIAEGKSTDRIFNIKVDLNSRKVVHRRSQPDYDTTP